MARHALIYQLLFNFNPVLVVTGIPSGQVERKYFSRPSFKHRVYFHKRYPATRYVLTGQAKANRYRLPGGFMRKK